MSAPDVVVIGAGAAGASCAYELARAGLRVTLLEEQPRPARGCSYGSAGLICPTHPTPLGTWSNVRTGAISMLGKKGTTRVTLEAELIPWLTRLMWATARPGFATKVAALLGAHARDSLALHQELVDAGVETSFSGSGILGLYASEAALRAELARADSIRKLLPGVGVTAEGLSRYIHTDVDAVGGVYSPGEGFVDSEQYVLGMVDAARTMGVDVRSGVGPVRLQRRGARVQTVQTEQEAIPARSVVVAAGVGSRGIGRQLGHRLPIVGATGYHVEFTSSNLEVSCPAYLPEAHLVLTPLAGRFRVSGMLDLGKPSVSTAERVRGVIDDVRRYFPKLDAEVSSMWSGQRPCTPDSLPIVGKPRGMENLLYATGHGMMGIALAPLTGRWIADLVLDRAGSPREFSPDRFLARDGGEPR
jgi:D-amino-acid dehydrogenase